MSKSKYQLNIPEALYDELDNIARAHEITVSDLVKKYLKLGVVASKPGIEVVIVDGSEEVTVNLWGED